MVETPVRAAPVRRYPIISIPRFIPAVKAATEPDKEEYVVKVDLLDRFPQGSVVHGYELPIGTDTERHCISGTLRPAMEHEKGKEFVDIADTLKPGIALTEQLNQANEAAAKLSAENQKLKGDLNDALTVKTADYDPDKDEKMSARWESLNAAIKRLDSQVKERDEMIETMRKQLNEKHAPTSTKTSK